MQTSEECHVYIANEVSGEDNDTRKPFYVIQQHTHIHIGIAICTGSE